MHAALRADAGSRLPVRHTSGQYLDLGHYCHCISKKIDFDLCRQSTHVFTSPRTRTVSRVQDSGSPRRMHVAQGIVLSHLTFRAVHARQERGTRWVERMLVAGDSGMLANCSTHRAGQERSNRECRFAARVRSATSLPSSSGGFRPPRWLVFAPSNLHRRSLFVHFMYSISGCFGFEVRLRNVSS